MPPPIYTKYKDFNDFFKDYSKRLKNFLKNTNHKLPERDYIEEQMEFIDAEIERAAKNHQGGDKIKLKRMKRCLMQKMQEDKTQSIPIPKLKWLAGPSAFSHIILELIKKGYIEPETTKKKISYKKIAEKCYQLFEFVGSKSNAESTLIREMQHGSYLSADKKKKFQISEFSKL